MNSLLSPAAPLTLATTDRTHDGAVISLTGDLDTSAVSVLSRAVQQELRPGIRLVLDVANMNFINSSGLSGIVAIVECMRIRRGSVVLRGSSPQLRRLVRLCALESIIRFEELDGRRMPTRLWPSEVSTT
jgi:anti-anti-sigma factor